MRKTAEDYHNDFFDTQRTNTKVTLDLINLDLFNIDQDSNIATNTLHKSVPEMVSFDNHKITMGMEKKLVSGQYSMMVDGIWTTFYGDREYIGGWAMTKDMYHYGVYEIEGFAPYFYGSWFAVWMFNLYHIPPEIDIVEVMCKKKGKDREWIQTSLHVGSEYDGRIYHESNDFLIKRTLNPDVNYKCKMFWSPFGFSVQFEDTTWYSSFDYFFYAPHLNPMNIIVSNGLGKWAEGEINQSELEAFTVTKFNYTKYNEK